MFGRQDRRNDGNHGNNAHEDASHTGGTTSYDFGEDKLLLLLLPAAPAPTTARDLRMSQANIKSFEGL